jgi:anti-sigma factor RsiW
LSCQKNQALLQGYIDGELDELNVFEIERHLDQCVECQLEYYNQSSLRSSFRDSSLYHHAPADFKERIRLSVQKEQALEPDQEQALEPDHS